MKITDPSQSSGIYPSFSVHRNGTDQTVTSDVSTKILWTTEEFDTNNDFDLTNSKFVPSVAGKYMLNLNVWVTDNTDWCQARIYKNGAEEIEAGAIGAAGEIIANASIILDMNGTTDYIEGYVYNGGGTTLSGNKVLTNFTGSKIG